jgi:hypothetical protein
MRRFSAGAATVALALIGAHAFAGAAFGAVAIKVGCSAGVGDSKALVRELKQANWRAASQLTVITLASDCTYTLTRVGEFAQTGPSGLPVVRRHVLIEGRGSEITRALAVRAFRIVSVGPKGNLTLEDLTISNGHAANGRNGANSVDADGGDGGAGRNGGGIHNQGRLTLRDVTVTGSVAGSGGAGGSSTTSDAADGPDNASGAGGDGVDAAAANGGDGGPGGNGGGIYNAGWMLIADSSINDNQAGNGGAGGDATGGRGGDGGAGTTTGGSGGDGGDAQAGKGGIGGDGGALLNRGTLFIDDSVLDGNQAGNAGDGGHAKGGRGGDAGGPHGNGGTGGNAVSRGADGGTGGILAVASGSAVLHHSSADGNMGGDAGFGGEPLEPGDAGTPGCEGTYASGSGFVMGGTGGVGGIFVAAAGNVTLLDVALSNNSTGTSTPSGPLGVSGGLGPPCT